MKEGFIFMIISEVLDAIDNINSITIESEISMCESLLSSYDKMLLIEEHYEGNDINDFKIFQEGVLSDAKDDVKKQNEGKSTLNKILFTIPRMIIALFKSIGNKIKGLKDKSKELDTNTKKASKETKNLLAKLFPKKSDGKVNVKEAVKNWGIAIGAGAAATAGVAGGTKLAKSVIASKNNKKITEQFIKNVNVDDNSKKKLHEQMLALVTYVNDYYIDAIKKSYGKISKFKKSDKAKQVDYCFNVMKQLGSDNKCKELCEPLRQYREDLYNTSIKEMKLKRANGKIVSDMEYLVCATIINHLDDIKSGSTSKQKAPIVKTNDNSAHEKIIKNIPPSGSIDIDIDDDNYNDDDDGTKSNTEDAINETARKIEDIINGLTLPRLNIIDSKIHSHIELSYDIDKDVYIYNYFIIDSTTPLSISYVIEMILMDIKHIENCLKYDDYIDNKDDPKNIKIPFSDEKFVHFSDTNNKRFGDVSELMNNLNKFISGNDYKKAVNMLNTFSSEKLSKELKDKFPRKDSYARLDREAFLKKAFEGLEFYVKEFNRFVSEFDVILKKLADLDNITAASEKLRKSVSNKHVIPEINKIDYESFGMGGDAYNGEPRKKIDFDDIDFD